MIEFPKSLIPLVRQFPTPIALLMLGTASLLAAPQVPRVELLLLIAGGLLLLAGVIVLVTELWQHKCSSWQQVHLGVQDKQHWTLYWKKVKKDWQRIHSDESVIQIDMAAHSLLAHFRPAPTPEAKDQGKLLAIDQLNLEGAMWGCGLREIIQDNNWPVHFRVVLIDPEGTQSKRIKDTQEGRKTEESRDAEQDGYETLFVLWKIMSKYSEKVLVDVCILREPPLTMMHSYCRCGPHVMIGVYANNLLAANAPCIYTNREKKSHAAQIGRDFADVFNDQSEFGKGAVRIDFKQFRAIKDENAFKAVLREKIKGSGDI